jgi:integrase
LAGRYVIEKAQHLAHPKDVAANKRRLKLLIDFFGKDKLITAITGGDVAKLVAWRRGHQIVKGINRKPAGQLIGARTVNDTIEQLRKLVLRAKTWGLRFEKEIVWRDHWLKEPEERKAELRGDQGLRLRRAARDDYEPVLRLAEITGLRQHELLLRWDEVRFDAEMIVKKGKGGRTVTAPITPEVRALLWPLRGHHSEFVFTYVCQRTRDGRVKGERHPITLSGLQTQWKRLNKRAGVTGFRFHDYRHDFGTKMLRQTGNLKLVQELMNHSTVKTTERYAHVLDEDKRAALAARAAARAASEAAPSTFQDAGVPEKVPENRGPRRLMG